MNITASNESATTYDIHAPPWLSPPIDAWAIHHNKLTILFVHYIICFFIGEFINLLCLLTINKTNLNASARCLMMVQCCFNTTYLSTNLPYKAIILYLQKIFLPHWPRVIFGWIQLWVVFGSVCTQAVMAFTRLIYIVFPHKANVWFWNARRSMIPAMIPMVFGCFYAFPSLHECCHRFYKFTTYAISYVGYGKEIQLKFSVGGTSVLLGIMAICYGIVIIKIRKSARKVAPEKQKEKRNDNKKKEYRLALLFGITGALWFAYLTFFYIIYWSGLFSDYSWLLLWNEMLEEVLFFMDPVVYIAMSSDLRKTVLKCFGKKHVTYTTNGGPG